MSEICEVCKGNKFEDGVCIDCGLPSKRAFISALKQAVKPIDSQLVLDNIDKEIERSEHE